MASGTRLVTLSGAVERPGVYEVDHGAPLGSVVALAGGSVADSGGVLVGGYFGAWLPPSAAVLALADDALAPYGAGVGAGIVAVLPAGHCGLAETARILRWLAAQSAGQCGPCTHGLPAIAAAFDGLVAGHRRAAAEVERLAAMVEGRGACGLPDGSIRLVRSALRVFGPDAEAHTGRGPCRAQRAVLPVPAPGGWR
jgi:NADH:ubiquinone oxidoreductase subunit F (NADH-binding)